MSRGLVSTRPFTKKKRKASLKRMMSKTWISIPTVPLNISTKAKEILSRSAIITILLTFWFIFLIRGVFFKSEFTMNQVKWSEQTIATYEDIDLFNIIAREIRGNNYYMLKNFEKSAILDLTKASYPFVHDIQFQLETGNTLWINIEYTEPLFKVKLGEKEFWIRWEHQFYEIQSGMTLGHDSFIVDTPQYLTGISTLSGFFYQVRLIDFIHIIPLIQEHVPNMNRFVYLAGSTRFAIFTDNGQTLYFNFQGQESLNEQFEKYHNLQQYYKDFDRLTTIDLGSLDETKVIVRKR